MNIIVTGRGTSGSWVIRGEQLGAAIGATVEPNASKLKGYDLGIVVKRAPSDLLHRIKVAGLPIVLDVLDAWPQPAGNDWSRDDCMAWLRGKLNELRPIALVAATQAMAHDCAEFGVPVLALPHHTRPGQIRNPIRDRVQRVGYEGGAQYLGPWEEWLRNECARRGWEFKVNPPALAALDIAVAVRNAKGYAAKYWKSNVKMANAQGSGTPCIINSEAGYTETQSGAEYFADTKEEFAASFDALADKGARKSAQERMIPYAPQLDRIANEYRAWLNQLKF